VEAVHFTRELGADSPPKRRLTMKKLRAEAKP
jgi:hypothetical protein